VLLYCTKLEGASVIQTSASVRVFGSDPGLVHTEPFIFRMDREDEGQEGQAMSDSLARSRSASFNANGLQNLDGARSRYHR
jgi:hypothetical protein